MSPSVARLPSLRRRRPTCLKLSAPRLPSSPQSLRSPRFHEDFNAPFRESIANASQSTIGTTSTLAADTPPSTPSTPSRIRRAFNNTFVRPRAGNSSGEASPVSPEQPKRTSPIADRFKEWVKSPVKKLRRESVEYTQEGTSSTSLEPRLSTPQMPSDGGGSAEGESSRHRDRRKEPDTAGGRVREAWWKSEASASPEPSSGV